MDDAQPPTAAPQLGEQIIDRAARLARHSDQADALTVAYLTPAHRATAADLLAWMREAGMQAHLDALGNVVGRYAAAREDAPTVMTGSHYDTVRDGGAFDGRLGILLPISVVAHLHAKGERLPCHLEIVAFAEEEGLRFRSSFLASSAIAGRFDVNLLEREDESGVSMHHAMREAGLPGTPESVRALARPAGAISAFVEVHIEQGPVLLDRGLALGVVTSIAGNVRMSATVTGMAGHAGTTPMTMRRDAAAAVAEMILAIEARCAQAPTLVGTVGKLLVPNGATNVIPGRCEFTIDVRAGDDATRDAAVADVLAACEAIAKKRRVSFTAERTSNVSCAPCAPSLMDALAAAVERAGVSPFRLPSGAGHDAMTIAHIAPIGMLFVRCGNGGISHNPLETMTAEDADLAARVFLDFLRHYRA